MESLIDHLASLPPDAVYLTITGVLLLCGLGLPIPEDVSLISAGYMAHLGVLSAHSAVAVCLMAVLAGDTLAFYLGRWFGRRLLASGRLRRVFAPRKQLRVRAYFRKFGSKVIFVGRFLPGLRFSIFFSAGTLHVRPAVFFIYDALAALLSVPALVYLAWLFGDQIDHVVAWSRRSEYGFLILAAGVAAIFIFRRMRKHRRHVAKLAAIAAAQPPPPANL